MFGVLFATILIQTTVASAIAISQARSDAFSALLRSAAAFNERVPSDAMLNGHTERVLRRDPSWSATHPGLQARIDSAVASTASRTHYFWTGRISPGTSQADDSMHPAMKIAQAKGGTTLELTLGDIPMPGFGGPADPDSEEIWQYASDEYALKASGDVYVVKGEILRSGNVWEVYEYPILKKRSEVKRIFEIKAHPGGKEDAPHQIYPELKGCDGVSFLDSEIICPVGSVLYYGSINKPMVTAKTSMDVDTKIKMSSTGKESGVIPVCTEIISSDFVLDLLTDSGACDAANSKGDNGVVMNKVKALITSSKNRNYIQRRGLLKTKLRVTGVPIFATLERIALDALVSLDYYARTEAATEAMTKEIDSIVKSATDVSLGLSAAWAQKVAAQPEIKAKLATYLEGQIEEKQKAAAAAQKRPGDCGVSSSSAPDKTIRAIVDPRVMGTFSGNFFSPLPRTSLEARAQRAQRSGPHAPPAPSCPCKGAPQKKIVPRSKTRTKPAPATVPRAPGVRPAARAPNPSKKRVARPANRPRRIPGKAAPRRRTTPKRRPKIVPKPARRPKGKARARRRR